MLLSAFEMGMKNTPTGKLLLEGGGHGNGIETASTAIERSCRPDAALQGRFPLAQRSSLS
jgi:hypothetical protein